jgi:Domain of Unknown Function (DUF1080)
MSLLMRKLQMGLVCFLFLARAANAAEPTPAITPDRPIKLFDGNSLAGCYTWLKDAKREDPRDVFRVTDGLLHIIGDGWGGILTNERYRDYHLVLEFKWGERAWHERETAARDSGLLVHCNGADGGYKGIWMPGLEVQIIEGGVGDFILVNGPDESGKPVPVLLTANVARDRDGEFIWQADGAPTTFDLNNLHRINWFGRDPDWKDERGFRGKRDVESPHGEWTRIDVIADGGKITVFVNGVKVNEAIEATPQAGRIQLQSELAEIFFRRWELWPLGQGPKPEPAESPSLEGRG